MALDYKYVGAGLMRILHVITAIQKAAGTSVFCCELCNELARRGHDVTIAVSVFSIKEWYETDSRVRLVSMNDIANGDERFDIIHMHGLWQTELHHLVKWALKHKIPLVWSPHGSLTAWAFRYKWWKKWPAWWLYQKRDLKNAAFIHVTAQSEVEDITRVGLKNKVIIAPLGVDLDDVSRTPIPGGGNTICKSDSTQEGIAESLKSMGQNKKYA